MSNVGLVNMFENHLQEPIKLGWVLPLNLQGAPSGDQSGSKTGGQTDCKGQSLRYVVHLSNSFVITTRKGIKQAAGACCLPHVNSR